MSQRILFVCLGNICRSPTAEAVFRRKAASVGKNCVVDSAGTASWHVGKSPYGPMQDTARASGYDMTDLRARTVAVEDFHRFDLVVAMDRDNLADLRNLQPTDGSAQLHLFSEFSETHRGMDVPDPYYTRDFEGALRMIEDCADALVHQLL